MKNNFFVFFLTFIISLYFFWLFFQLFLVNCFILMYSFVYSNLVFFRKFCTFYQQYFEQLFRNFFRPFRIFDILFTSMILTHTVVKTSSCSFPIFKFSFGQKIALGQKRPQDLVKRYCIFYFIYPRF